MIFRKDINREQLIQDYLDGVNTKLIMKKYNVNIAMVYRILHKANIPFTRHKSSGLNLKNLNKDQVISLYRKLLSSTKVSKILNCSRTLIDDFLHKNNIKRTPFEDINRKYKNIRKDYFDVIDTEEKAYFLGLLYADGNLNQKMNCMSIALQEGDRKILETFSLAILGEIALRPKKPKNEHSQKMCNFRIWSQHLGDHLNKWGCVPNKSLILTWPEWLIDLNLQRHFIRGYFDGDGSLSRCETHHPNSFNFNITSTYWFCEGAKKIITSTLPINISLRTNENGITTILETSGNRQILKLMNWLYDGATIYLDRKYQKYFELQEVINQTDVKYAGKRINQYC